MHWSIARRARVEVALAQGLARDFEREPQALAARGPGLGGVEGEGEQRQLRLVSAGLTSCLRSAFRGGAGEADEGRVAEGGLGARLVEELVGEGIGLFQLSEGREVVGETRPESEDRPTLGIGRAAILQLESGLGQQLVRPVELAGLRTLAGQVSEFAPAPGLLGAASAFRWSLRRARVGVSRRVVCDGAGVAAATGVSGEAASAERRPRGFVGRSRLVVIERAAACRRADQQQKGRHGDPPEVTHHLPGLTFLDSRS